MSNLNARVKVRIPAAELARRIGELAAEINRDYARSERLGVVAILKGSVLFLADLVRQLTVPVEIDFCQAASYGQGQEPGEVHFKKDVDLPLRGADVLLVEDIVDSGWTVRALLDLLRNRRPKSLRLCTLLDKAEARVVEVPIDYCGFRIPREFVVGYGLDWGERYRQLPYIGVVESPSEENP